MELLLGSITSVLVLVLHMNSRREKNTHKLGICFVIELNLDMIDRGRLRFEVVWWRCGGERCTSAEGELDGIWTERER